MNVIEMQNLSKVTLCFSLHYKPLGQPVEQTNSKTLYGAKKGNQKNCVDSTHLNQFNI